jgi:predicted nucleic acid-binding protein
MMSPHKSTCGTTWLIDPDIPLVIDSSVAISLTGTGLAKEILEAIPNPILVERTVKWELSNGRSNGRRNIDILEKLIAANIISVVSMSEESASLFETLVIGRTADTLDDGEAATVSHAVDQCAIAVIDERKAIRICSDRFPELQLASTVDLLSHPQVGVKLGTERVHLALDRALRETRMRVLPHNQAWVLQIIGENSAASYPSLPKSLRIRSPLTGK